MQSKFHPLSTTPPDMLIQHVFRTVSLHD
jgi:hypothetical protein